MFWPLTSTFCGFQMYIVYQLCVMPSECLAKVVKWLVSWWVMWNCVWKCEHVTVHDMQFVFYLDVCKVNGVVRCGRSRPLVLCRFSVSPVVHRAHPGRFHRSLASQHLCCLFVAVSSALQGLYFGRSWAIRLIYCLLSPVVHCSDVGRSADSSHFPNGC